MPTPLMCTCGHTSYIYSLYGRKVQRQCRKCGIVFHSVRFTRHFLVEHPERELMLSVVCGDAQSAPAWFDDKTEWEGPVRDKRPGN